MMKLNARETQIFFITLGLAVFFVVYQFVFKPIHEGSLDIDDRLSLDQERFIKASQLLAQKDQIEDRYQHLINLIGAAGSDESQIPTIVAKVEAAARESNIHISNIQPQRSNILKEIVFLGVELEIDGQWLDIVKFLNLIQQQPNFYFIDELNLEKYSGTVNSLRGRVVISRISLVNP